jgi:hypothetical protein
VLHLPLFLKLKNFCLFSASYVNMASIKTFSQAQFYTHFETLPKVTDTSCGLTGKDMKGSEIRSSIQSLVTFCINCLSGRSVCEGLRSLIYSCPRSGV